MFIQPPPQALKGLLQVAFLKRPLSLRAKQPKLVSSERRTAEERGVYMNPASPIRRASPLARVSFHPILNGSLSGGLALPRGPDILTSVTSSFCYGLITIHWRQNV